LRTGNYYQRQKELSLILIDLSESFHFHFMYSFLCIILFLVKSKFNTNNQNIKIDTQLVDNKFTVIVNFKIITPKKCCITKFIDKFTICL
jgi:hypothetical protein